MLFIAMDSYLSLILIFLGGNDAETQKANGAEEAGDADILSKIVARIATVDEAAEDEAKVDAAAVGRADFALTILMAEAKAKS